MTRNCALVRKATGVQRGRHHACDFCRKRKIKCDGPRFGAVDNQPNHRTTGSGSDVQCSNCAASHVECTFGRVKTKKSVPKNYIAYLEERQERLQVLLEKLLPSVDLAAEVGPYVKPDSWIKTTRSSSSPQSAHLQDNNIFSKAPQSLHQNSLQSFNGHVWPPFPPKDLLQALTNLYFCHVNILWPLLHQPTFEADLMKERHRCDIGFASVVLSLCAVASRHCSDSRVLAKVRPMRRHVGDAAEIPSRLCMDGIDSWADDLEIGITEGQYASKDSAGWKYYNRIQHCFTSTMEESTLCELQTAHLTHQFLLGLSDACSAWVVVGAALRKAQAMNLHSNKTYISGTLEGELWKRAFWCLVVSDRLTGVECGRSSYSRHEESVPPVTLIFSIDVGLPLEIDDEYWSTPDANGTSGSLGQPAKRPSTISGFNVYVELSAIYDWTMRSLYAANKRSPQPKVSTEHQRDVSISEISKTLDAWRASIHPHLTWESEHCSTPTWRAQSTRIHLTCRLLQMHLYQHLILDTLPPINHGHRTGSTVGVRGGALYQPSAFSPTLAIFAHAALTNIRILYSMLCQISSNDPNVSGHMPVDVPALINGAVMTGLMITAVRITGFSKYRVNCKATTGCIEGIEDDLNSLESSFPLDVCMDILQRYQERSSIHFCYVLQMADGETGVEYPRISSSDDWFCGTAAAFFDSPRIKHFLRRGSSCTMPGKSTDGSTPCILRSPGSLAYNQFHEQAVQPTNDQPNSQPVCTNPSQAPPGFRLEPPRIKRHQSNNRMNNLQDTVVPLPGESRFRYIREIPIPSDPGYHLRNNIFPDPRIGASGS
ncbi:hypothetical protein K439DRAFT_1620942 [Ramaria rubella]|nr:hypothetical protein K439DRAFT_1620942 [Ramaria rubella]